MMMVMSATGARVKDQTRIMNERAHCTGPGFAWTARMLRATTHTTRLLNTSV